MAMLAHRVRTILHKSERKVLGQTAQHAGAWLPSVLKLCCNRAAPAFMSTRARLVLNTPYIVVIP